MGWFYLEVKFHQQGFPTHPASTALSEKRVLRSDAPNFLKRGSASRPDTKNTVLLMAFRIASRPNVKTVWFGRHKAVCFTKRHKSEILCVVNF